jgi:hypothetical protein
MVRCVWRQCSPRYSSNTAFTAPSTHKIESVSFSFYDSTFWLYIPVSQSYWDKTLAPAPMLGLFFQNAAKKLSQNYPAVIPKLSTPFPHGRLAPLWAFMKVINWKPLD